MGWPTGFDVQARLTAMGLLPNPVAGSLVFLNLGAKALAASAEFERRTGWLPFLAGPAGETRLFDPPGPTTRDGEYLLALQGGGRILDLQGGLLSLAALSISGIAYTVDDTFWLKPSNAPNWQRPYTWVEFVTPVFGRPNAIAVTGTWGYADQVPDDVFEAVTQGALALCYGEIALSLSKGLLKWSEGDVSRDYSRVQGTGPLVAEAAVWRACFEATVARYRRLHL